MCTNWFCNMHVLHIERVCGMCVEIGEKHVHSIRQVKLCVLPFDLKIVWNAFSAPYIVNVVFVFFFYSMQRLMCTVSMAKLLLSFFFFASFLYETFRIFDIRLRFSVQLIACEFFQLLTTCYFPWMCMYSYSLFTDLVFSKRLNRYTLFPLNRLRYSIV